LRVGNSEGDFTTVGDVDGALVESNVIDSVGVMEGLNVNDDVDDDGDAVDDDGEIVGEIVGDGRNEGESKGVFVGSCDDDCVGSLEG
jgi:hypothetical protein